MARKKKNAKPVVNEKNLSKGDLRKLKALRKSLGQDIADEAFAKWSAQGRQEARPAADPNIGIIEEALAPLLGELRFPRGGGYVLRRGRGRVVVELMV